MAEGYEELYESILGVGQEEELFARDDDGQLMRYVKASEKDFQERLEVTVDGVTVKVRKAVPLTDSQGNILHDENGITSFRRTTIWDAAHERYVKSLGTENPIPVLCHQEHLRPAAVCRLCTVETFRVRNGVRTGGGGKLLPACFQPCEGGMDVHTVESPEKEIAERVRKSVGILTEMLCADHVSPDRDATVPHELAQLAERLGCNPDRFAPRVPVARPADDSSELIRINHDSCILCDRCVRSCDEVKLNHVIGRAGKGYGTRIAFGLDDLMGTSESGCVSCGECMMNCPTDALTFRNPVESDWLKEKLAEPGYSPVTAEELRALDLFRSVNFKFLQWNAGAAVRRKVKKGEVLCSQGEYGSTAFILLSGEYAVLVGKLVKKVRLASGFFGNILSRFTSSGNGENPRYTIDPGPYGNRVGTLGPEDVIVGEMTCMNSHPRTATIIADKDGEVLEVRRNVLYMLQRNLVSRRHLDRVYRERALQNHLSKVPFFDGLDRDERDRCIALLKDKVTLVRCDPGELIFRQGEEGDAFYMVRIGHVKVSLLAADGTEERVLNYLRPDQYFGEIGLVNDIGRLLGENIPDKYFGRRTATCTALDDVELVKVQKADFDTLVREVPKLLRKVLDESRRRLRRSRDVSGELVAGPMGEFLSQGLFNGQKLLVLDLEKCTRCDECSKACADTHGGVTRLIREGLRFDRYLVASACRSCTDPYCLVGCPVDSIHREGTLNIRIESHCIGCGQCAKNCPYGNINMTEFPDSLTEGGREKAIIRMKATTCDLCQSVPAVAGRENVDVSCVYSCPHDAAFRLTGEELYDRVRPVLGEGGGETEDIETKTRNPARTMA